MHDQTDADHEALLARLAVIEQQPLADRPASYAALYDELARRLQAPPARTEPT